MATFGQPLAGGWELYYVLPQNVYVRVRFAQRDSGRLEPVATYIEGGSDDVSITGEMIRNIPFGHLESIGNGARRTELIEDIEAEGQRVSKATDTWLKVLGRGERGPGLFRIDPGTMKKLKRRALRLKIPKEPKKPDEFYRRVADLYMALTESGSRRPAAEIAEANKDQDVEITRVHRWIREARAREKARPGSTGLTAAKSGKAG